MKKFFLITFAVVLMLALPACSMNGNNPDGNNSATVSENDNTTNGHVNSGNAQDGTINSGNDNDGVVSKIVSDTMSMTESMVSKVK